jgi:hypothetical protein
MGAREGDEKFILKERAQLERPPAPGSGFR